MPRRAIWLLLFACGCIRQPSTPGLDCAPDEALARAVEASNLEQGPWPLQWWELYGDPQLNCYIELALENNPTIRQAYGALLGALATRGVERSVLLPEVDVGVNVTRQELSLNGPFGPALATQPGATGMSFIPHVFTDYDLFTTITWTLDVWGKYRHLVAAAEGEVQARAAEVDYTRVTLSVSVALAYFKLQTAMERLKVAEQMAAAQRQLLYLIEERLHHGLDNGVSLESQKEEVAQAEGVAAAIKLDLEEARHHLAALLDGHWDLEVAAAQINVSALPIPENLPLNWLAHRLDLIAQRDRVVAAAHYIKAARADFYPNVNLNGIFGLDSLHPHNWLESRSAHMSWGPAISLPIFDFGKRYSNLQGRKANYMVAVEQYNSTLLTAVQQVLDGLSMIRQTGLEMVQAQSQEEASHRIYQLIDCRVERGIDTELTLLEATTDWLRFQDNYLVTRERQLEAQLSLVQAVGGGASAYPS